MMAINLAGFKYSSIDEMTSFAHQIYDDSPEGVLIINDLKEICYFNKKVAHISGFSQEDLMNFDVNILKNVMVVGKNISLDELIEKTLSQSIEVFTTFEKRGSMEIIRYNRCDIEYTLNLFAKSFEVNHRIFIFVIFLKNLKLKTPLILNIIHSERFEKVKKIYELLGKDLISELEIILDNYIEDTLDELTPP